MLDGFKAILGLPPLVHPRPQCRLAERFSQGAISIDNFAHPGTFGGVRLHHVVDEWAQELETH